MRESTMNKQQPELSKNQQAFVAGRGFSKNALAIIDLGETPLEKERLKLLYLAILNHEVSYE